MLAYGTITISDEMRGSGIYKITTAPASYTATTGGFTPTYRIALSTVKSQAGVTEVLIGDILEYSYYHYPVGYVDGSYVYLGPRVSFRGATGASATAYSLIVSHAAIVKAEDGTFTPDEITLTAKSQTGTAAMANYTGRLVVETTTDNSTWTNRYNQDAATYTYTIPSGIVAVRCSLYVAGGTATLLDQQIVPVVSDGGKGEDAYTVILTNENHTFAGGTSAALAGSTTCNVVAYKGATQVAATIGTISGAPTGMSTTITSNGTTSAYFTVTVTTSMVTKNGVLTVPVTVDGKSFSMKFSYSLALTGVSVTNVTSTNNTQDGGTSVITVTLSDGTTKTFNVKNGNKGSTGDTAEWFYGTALTHTSGTATASVTGAVVGSMYLNVETSLVYKCTAISGSTMTWTYAGDLTTGVINNITVGGRNYYVVADAENGYLNETGGVNSYEVEDSTPYIFRRTGDGKSNIGDHELDEIVGCSVAWNQLAGNFSNRAQTLGITITADNANGSITVSGTATATNNLWFKQSISVVAGHKYLLRGAKTNGIKLGITGTPVVDSGNGMIIEAISQYPLVNLLAYFENAQTYNETLYPQLFDLTAMFGTTVADALYVMGADGIALFRSWYPKDYYPYAEATLEHVSGLEAHEMVGFNQWDGTYKDNGYYNANGDFTTNDRYCAPMIKIFPSTQYYYRTKSGLTGTPVTCWFDVDKNPLGISTRIVRNGLFTTPANAHFMSFALVKSEINDICINISDPSRNGTYEPYKKYSYPLDSSLTLRGLLKYDSTNGFYVDGDTYASDGTVTRKYGEVTLDGSESWTMFAEGKFYAPVIGVNEAASSTTYYMSNLYPFAENGATVSANVTEDKHFYGQRAYGRFWVYDSAYTTLAAFKSALATRPLEIVYPLTTPTTETAIAYASKQKCDDYGTEEYITTGLVPVGHNTQYATPEYTSDYIDVTPSETIIFQSWITRPTLWMAYCFYDANKALVGSRVVETSTTDKYKGLTIEVPSNAYYMRVSSKIYDTGQVDVEHGNVATEWSIAPEDVEDAISTAQTTADIALTSANGKNKVYHQDSQPSGGTYIAGDTWFDTDDGYKMYTYDGSSWVAEEFGTNAISDLAITNAKIADATIQSAKIATVDAGKITTGVLDAARIDAGSITIGKLDTSTQNTISNASTNSELALSRSIEYIIGTQTAATGSWTGVTTDTTLVAGKTIAYKLPYAGSGSASLNLTLAGGDTTGAKAVYLNTTRVTTHFGAGAVINMTYDGSYWRASSIPNSNTYDRRLHNNAVLAATAITAAHLIGGTASGYKNLAASVAFDLSYPILYASAAINAAAAASNTYEAFPSVNFSTSGTIQGATANKVVYLKGSISGNTFTCASSNYLTCTVPTSADSMYYIPLGVLANGSTTTGYFSSSNRLYAYLNGAFQAVDTAAKDLANDAAKTATNYITYIDSTNGIRVYDGQSANQNVNYAQLNSSGMQIVKGGTQTASFGDSIVLGETERTRANIDFNSMELIDKNNNVYFSVGDLRDDTGYANISERFVGTGANRTYATTLITYVYTITIDGTATTAFTTAALDQNHIQITFTNAPADGAQIIVNGRTSSDYAKSYTLGTRGSEVIGPMSVSEGYQTDATAYASHSEGTSSKAYGNSSHAEGGSTTANGQYSHAEGAYTSTGAIGAGSHAEGYNSFANSSGSHAEGGYTVASAVASHAEGSNTTSSGLSSHAEGSYSVASGAYSHAQNRYTEAAGENQTAIGKYNIVDSGNSSTSNAFIIGNGTDDESRSNAFAVRWDGDVHVNGVPSIISQNGTYVENGTSVDTIKAPGNYIFALQGSTYTYTNMPFSSTSLDYVYMSVIAWGATNVVQIAWLRQGDGTVKYRKCAAGTWSSWFSIVTKTITPTFTVNSTDVSTLTQDIGESNGWVMCTFRAVTKVKFDAGTNHIIGTVTPKPSTNATIYTRSASNLTIQGWVGASNGAVYVNAATAVNSGQTIEGFFLYKA